METFRIFNSVATFVWCCVEDGLTQSEISARFVETFGHSSPDADEAIATLLHRWQGLGYISGVQGANPLEIDLTTALGSMLGSPLLREHFARSPSETANLLGLRRADREPFLALDAEALDRQARALVRKKRSRPERGVNATVSSFLGRFLSSDRRPSGQSYYYRLLSRTFAVRYDTAEQEKLTHPVFAHLETKGPGKPHVEFNILSESVGHILLEGSTPFAMCSDIAEIAPRLSARLSQCAVNPQNYLMIVHTAVLRKHDKCVMLPGASGSGKSTLAAALMRSGFQYLTDEAAFVELETLQVQPIPLSISIKPSPDRPLRDYYPHLETLSEYTRDDGRTIRYLSPPREALPSVCENIHLVTHIIFPRYDPKARTRLRPMGKVEAFERLMDQTTILVNPLDESRVASLLGWFRRVECSELSMSSLDDAVALVQSACGQ
jgi:hypothetical protein